VLRSWFASKWVRIWSAIFIVFVAAVLAAPFLIPVDRYRPLLVGALESRTGRTIYIDRLELRLVPTVRIRVVNFRMENPSGFPAGNALTADSIDLGISPRALLSRRLDVSYIAPAGVQVHVLRNSTGSTNFAKPVPLRNAAPRQPLFALERVGIVNVKGATITFADALGREQPAQSYALSGVSAKVTSIEPQAADWAQKLNIAVDLRGAKLTTLLLTTPVDFKTGTFTYKNGAGRATFSSSAGAVSLAGSAGFERLDPLSITFAVSGPELDLKALARLVRTGKKSAAAKTNKLLARGTIKLGKVLYAPLKATNMSGRLSIYADSVRLDDSTLSAYGGRVREAAVLDGSPGVPVAVSARVSGLDVERVLAVVGVGTGKVTGTLEANFNANTLLANDPKQALAATGTFAVRNGSLPGMALNGSMVQVAQIAGVNVPSGDTHFSFLGGDLHIAHQRGSSNELRMLSPGMQATMHGSFAFDQSLDYNGTAVLDTLRSSAPSNSSPLLAAVGQMVRTALRQNLAGSQIQAPFTLRGTLGNPQFKLAGTPQLLTTQPQIQAVQQQIKQPGVQDLIQLIPGLHL
jgi:uncharacterized protein involved in outer membrane biogenesis